MPKPAMLPRPLPGRSQAAAAAQAAAPSGGAGGASEARKTDSSSWAPATSFSRWLW